MVFKANPLALSVPERAFESWLRDSGYLEILDQRTSDLHRLSAADSTIELSNSSADFTTTSIICSGFFVSLFSRIWTLLSLITFNPFSKLVAEDFSGDTPSWTLAFFGSSDSYSFPSSPSQARLRVHENVKRFARNYAMLFIVIFACSLYQLPLALVGLISCLALWDVFKFCADRWELYKRPSLRQTLLHIAQCGVRNLFLDTMDKICVLLGITHGTVSLKSCKNPVNDSPYSGNYPLNFVLTSCNTFDGGLSRLMPAIHSKLREAFGSLSTAIILFFFNVQFALLCALGVSYAVLILHASFRKLTPVKQS